MGGSNHRDIHQGVQTIETYVRGFKPYRHTIGGSNHTGIYWVVQTIETYIRGFKP